MGAVPEPSTAGGADNTEVDAEFGRVDGVPGVCVMPAGKSGAAGWVAVLKPSTMAGAVGTEAGIEMAEADGDVDGACVLSATGEATAGLGRALGCVNVCFSGVCMLSTGRREVACWGVVSEPSSTADAVGTKVEIGIGDDNGDVAGVCTSSARKQVTF